MTADHKDEEKFKDLAPVGESLISQDRASSASPPPAQAQATTTGKRGDAVPQAEPPLPYDEAPPLPDEPLPEQDDDGWEPTWEPTAQAWYFYNRRTGASQWENPRVPEATAQSHGPYDRNLSSSAALPTTSGAPGTSSPPKRKWGGYNPAIHGSYDPNADYAREANEEDEDEETQTAAVGLPNAQGQEYLAQAHFNRFTGKMQQADAGPEMHNDANKSKRQMNAFFDVDAAANSHDGRSLKAERRSKAISKKELKAFKEKRHSKKEEKRRAWLRD